jgi:hypothetical protein
MADQDFNINIRTLADTTGIKLTQAQLEALQDSAAAGNQKAAQALKQLADAQKQAQETSVAGLSGTAIGVGTIVSLVTGAISKWKAFNDEQDRMVDGMIKAEEKARALGESILAIQDAARSAARVDTEPLEQSFARLTHEVAVLKTEQGLLNLPEQGEEWKKYNKEISETEALLHKVTAAMQKQKAEADRDKEKAAKEHEKEGTELKKKVGEAEKDFEGKYRSAGGQAQLILTNEEDARMAREAGHPETARRYEESADALKRGATPAERGNYEILRATLNQTRILEQMLQQWR